MQGTVQEPWDVTTTTVPTTGSTILDSKYVLKGLSEMIILFLFTKKIKERRTK
jgi:hypothetical protein